MIINAERDYAAEERMRGAAKEMYEALRKAINAPWGNYEWIAEAQAAIAKAEGKS